MSYSIPEIKVAAFNWRELPHMTQRERDLWQGLGYCYEWFRCHKEDKDKCDKLAQEFIEFYEKGKDLYDS